MIVGDEGNDDFDFRALTGIPVTAEGAGGDDIIKGGNANDMLSGGPGKDDIDGGGGNDALFGGGDNDIIKGGPGNDVIQGEGGDDNLQGGDGEDNLEGGSGRDDMDGGAGNDQMLGGTGNDIMKGGDGSDRMLGESGDDEMEGGAGDDQMFGDVGNDNLQTGPGADYASGGIGQDIVSDGTLVEDADGTVTIMVPDTTPSDSAQTVFVQKTFRVDGDLDSDNLNGDEGNDVVIGGFNDFLYGQKGADMLFVGIGAEWADGGAGNDTLQYNLVHPDPKESGGYVSAELRSDRLIGHAIQDSEGGIPISGATNADPIVITSNNHGLSTGDLVVIEDVQGNTAANGTFTVTRVDDNQFSLDGGKGNNNYSGGGKFSRAKKVGSDTIKFRQLVDATTIITEIEEFTSAKFGPGPDEFTIAGTPAPLNVTLGAGADTLRVTGTDHSIFADADGGVDTLIIDISADTTARTGWIEPSQTPGINSVRVRGLGLIGSRPGETFQGNWDPNSGAFPNDRSISEPGATPIAKDFWIVEIAGVFSGIPFAVGDVIYALQDNPSTTTFAANWERGAPVDATNFQNLEVQLGQADDTLTVDKATFFEDHSFFGNGGDDTFFVTPDDASFGDSKSLTIRGDAGDDVADIIIDMLLDGATGPDQVAVPDPSLKQWGVTIDTLRIDNSGGTAAETWELRDQDIFVQDKDPTVHSDAMIVMNALVRADDSVPRQPGRRRESGGRIDHHRFAGQQENDRGQGRHGFFRDRQERVVSAVATGRQTASRHHRANAERLREYPRTAGRRHVSGWQVRLCNGGPRKPGRARQDAANSLLQRL